MIGSVPGSSIPRYLVDIGHELKIMMLHNLYVNIPSAFSSGFQLRSTFALTDGDQDDERDDGSDLEQYISFKSLFDIGQRRT